MQTHTVCIPLHILTTGVCVVITGLSKRWRKHSFQSQRGERAPQSTSHENCLRGGLLTTRRPLLPLQFACITMLSHPPLSFSHCTPSSDYSCKPYTHQLEIMTKNTRV